MKAHDSKSCRRFTPSRGFKSLPLRQIEVGTFYKVFQAQNNKSASAGGFFVASGCMKKVRIPFLLKTIHLYKHHKKYGTFCNKTNKSLIRLICRVLIPLLRLLYFSDIVSDSGNSARLVFPTLCHFRRYSQQIHSYSRLLDCRYYP